MNGMAADQVYIKIDGSGEAGKTLLIERLLEYSRSKCLAAVKFLGTESWDKPDVDQQGNEETSRFSKAGAERAVLYRYPVKEDGEGCGWPGDIVSGYWDGVIIEGRCNPVFKPDLSVFVTRPLGENEPLVSRERREAGRIGFNDYIRLTTGVELEVDPVIHEDGDMPEDANDEIEEGEIIEIPDDYAGKLIDYVKHGYPVHQDMWGIRESQAGIAEASVVVVNIYDEAECPGAERLVKELRRIREDQEICRDIFGGWVSLRSQSVYIANLAHRQDQGLKKALARIKRATPGRPSYGMDEIE